MTDFVEMTVVIALLRALYETRSWKVGGEQSMMFGLRYTKKLGEKGCQKK
jgi:hypothetical protein